MTGFCESVLGVAPSGDPVAALNDVDAFLKTAEGTTKFSQTQDVNDLQAQRQECAELLEMFRSVLKATATKEEASAALRKLTVYKQKLQRRLFGVYIASVSVLLLGYSLQGKGLDFRPKKSKTSKGKGPDKDGGESGESQT